MRDIAFESAGPALLRAAVLPLPGTGPAARAPAGPAFPPDATARPDVLREHVAHLMSDPPFAAALGLASASLAREARKVAAGGSTKPARMRRLLVSLVKYRLRMTYRATPFGLFAGVALAGFGAGTACALGTGHRSVSRPDAAWLDEVLTRLLAVPGVPELGRLTANNLCVERDGRLTLVYAHDSRGGGRLGHSVRRTAVVRYAMEAAAEPTAWPALVDAMTHRFPGAPEGAVQRSVNQLAQNGFLLNDIVPPPDCTSPLRHVLDRVGGHDHPLVGALRAVEAALTGLDSATADERGPLLAAAADLMRPLAESDDLIQSDLALDARTVLPDSVAREAERAATALWRASLIRPGSPSLRAYHAAFLERYGTDRAVPVLELLDEATGLGVPEAYRGREDARPEAHPGTAARDAVLGELFVTALGTAREAAADGAAPPVAEVVLDEETLDALGPETTREPPASLELGAELVADDWESLARGDFRLVLGANPGSPLAGATFSRFGHVLGSGAAQVRQLVEAAQAGTPPGETVACVAYRPRVGRSANVTRVPQWLAHRIPLGVGPAAADGTCDLRLEDLGVCADLDGLYLTDSATGRRVRPTSYSMLNPSSGHLPDVARFLLELGQEGQEWCVPWNWGAFAAAPAQPRVRYGRTVLAPARWLPDRALRDAASGDAPEWDARVAQWRARWGIPRHVALTRADNRITVDLDDPLHRLVLLEETRRGKGPVVVECYGGPGRHAWCAGPDGAHANEFVFPLVSTTAARRSAAGPPPVPRHLRRRPGPRAAARARTHVPGGEWLYAKLYVPDAHHRAVLTRRLDALLRGGSLPPDTVSGWFFIRYADPDPHLRLRFHGTPDTLWPSLLPALNRWAESLRDAGLLSRLVLDTYDPEVERYGGAGVHRLAERVFQTDSECAVAQLAVPAARWGSLTDTMLAALGILHLLTRVGTGEEALRWLSGENVLARRGEVSREQKDTLAHLLDPEGRPRTPEPAPVPGADGPALAPRWAERRAALEELAAALGGTGAADDRRAPVGLSLAHMHCNRFLGIKQEQEVLAHAMAREALALRLQRGRHGR